MGGETMNLILSGGREEDDFYEDGDDDDHGVAVVVGFEPTEDELMLHFLRPQLRGFAPRVAGAVVEADPCGAVPWELVARHGRRDEGFFFSARARKRPSVRRTVAGSGGGSWMHSSTKNGQSVTDLGVVVRWCRVNFCFYARGDAGQRSTGWVMAEYEITDPRCYRRADDGEEDDFWVLCHVRKSSRFPAKISPAKPRRRKPAAAGEAARA
ncbi:NAC domain-containing protein 48-like [Oryza brachyantha]|uniref:NAC domain-containing protein 48-like n=1 Tax=Oryza brachyantha TaxID=4533 RepID=UPI001ADA5ACE|nr:NAC domain-containing protein 48-like [Oryza brachyantha]